MAPKFSISVILATVLILSACSSSDRDKEEAVSATPPTIYKIDFDTSRGAFVVEVHSEWAPYGAEHLYGLVRRGFYNGDRFFRVVRGFVVQFGINGDPKVNNIWASTNIPDDRRIQSNDRGMLTFASTVNPNSRSTQLFINLRNNGPQLDPLSFAPVGKVISGMDVVDDIYGGYGEMAPRGSGPDPTQIALHGNDYLQSRFPHLDYIRKATIEK